MGKGDESPVAVRTDVPRADATDVTVTVDEGLLKAYERFERAPRNGRPGTVAAVELAQARLDLALRLQADGLDLPDLVASQLERDADELLRTTPPLPEP